MSRWVSRALARVRALAAQRKVRFTHKALRELAALDLGLDEDDACRVLAGLTAREAVRRLVSSGTGEWMYVFRSRIAGVPVYLKLVVREECVVVSFHEEEEASEEHESW